jgi:hypothetical protein
MTDELEIYRLQRESEDLERFEAKLLETAAQLKLYRQRHNRDPETLDTLRLWVLTEFDRPIDPYEVLTRAEIAQLWEDAEY